MRNFLVLVFSIYAYFNFLQQLEIIKNRDVRIPIIKEKLLNNIDEFPVIDAVKKDLCILFRPILNRYTKVKFYNRSDEYIKNEYKYAIFTVAFDYKVDDYSLFMNSLQKTGYNGDIFVLINADIRDDVKNYLSLNNIKPLYISNDWPYYLSINTEYPISRSELSLLIPKRVVDGYYKTSMTRYFVLNVFLRKYGSKYKYGMMVDLKDVFFQLNPFSWNIPEGISLFEESRAIPLIRNKANFYWVKKYNRSLYYLKNNYILNGGQVYFTYPDILYFLDEFNMIVRTAEHVDPEQAIINIIGHTRNYTNRRITIFSNYFGPVRLMHSDITYLEKDFKMKRKDIFYKDLFDYRDNKIVNCDGSIPLFIHFVFYKRGAQMMRIINSAVDFI